jgi:HAD superfamily hydrolase (TIGR01549 family)
MYFPSAEACYDELFKVMADSQPTEIEKARKWFWQNYMPLMVKVLGKHFTLRPHAKELLEALRAKGIRTAVLSDYGMAREKLEAIGCSPDWFDEVLESPAIGGLKPCKETFLNACKALGVEPGEALMVGDKVSTDGGALEAGMRFVHILKKEKLRDKGGVSCNEMLWDEFVSLPLERLLEL